MSINVTVTGNPISIQKGRMVTASPNHSKKEFERRRLIRISQVRQQSKNIAEDVRNRVKQQKLRQIEEIEKEGQKKLKQWQAKKLLELQNQCHEALKDIGAGHKGASLLEDEENILLDKRENEESVAKIRADLANRKLREQKKKAKHNVSVPTLKRKLVRQMENKRAQMISGLKQSSGSLKKKSDDKLSIDTEISGIVTDSDSDYEDIDESILKERNVDISFKVDNNSENFKNNIPSTSNNDEMKNIAKNSTNIESFELPDNDDQLLKELREQRDTRISDRIKKRSSHQLIQPDICDTLTKRISNGNIHKCASERDVANTPSNSMFSSIQQNIYACSCSRQSPVVRSPTCCGMVNRTPSTKKPVSNINTLKCFDTTDEEEVNKKCRESQRGKIKKTTLKPVLDPADGKVQVREIPNRPKVTLKSVKSPIKPSVGTSRTPLQSKSSKSRLITSHVERITEENLIISPEPLNNDDFLEKIRQRDRDALIRGQKALEREKLQREYNDLLKKLPALQKLERLYEMNEDKPEYHMTEERLREQEKRKQSILDDTYEKLFPDRRPPTITIPVKNKSISATTQRDEILLNQDSQSLNLGTWENERKTKKLYTEEEVEILLREGKIPSESKFRTDQLKTVLEKLRKQKEEILKEIHNQNLSEALPFTISSKVDLKNEGSSSDSSIVGYSSKKDRSTSTPKKFVSVKVGTNPGPNSSSSDTAEEPVKKQPKVVTQTTKSKSKQVQVASVSKKMKSPIVQKLPKQSKKTDAKEQKIRRDISSSSEQSISDIRDSQRSKNTKTTSVQKSSKDNEKQVAKEHKIRKDISSSSEQSLSDSKVVQLSKKTKETNISNFSKDGTRHVAKEHKIRKDISSSSEQSLSDSQVAQISRKSKSPSQKSSHQNAKHAGNDLKSTKSNASEHIGSDLKRSGSKESVKSSHTANSSKAVDKKKIVILSNTVIPSVPTNSLTSINGSVVDKKSATNQSKQMKSCECVRDNGKKTSELCEIVIKINNGKSSEVLIKDKSNSEKDRVKSLVVEKPRVVDKPKMIETPKIVEKPKNVEKPIVIEKKTAEKPAVIKNPEKLKEAKPNQRYIEMQKALNDDCCRSRNDSKPESWHEKFSKNNSQISTSSTSYMSPPHLPNKPSKEGKAPPYFCDLIGKKPQQFNINEMTPIPKIPVENHNVLGEVQKLLAMSRQSIDELGVSSVSTVTTPSQSIIDLESNKATSTAYSSSNTRTDLLNELCQSRNTLPNFSFLTVSSENRTITTSEIDSNQQYPDVLAKYAKIADQCSQRISDLTSMIEKVREDKNRMLQTSSLLPTNNDSSTKYMELPSPNKSTNTKDSTNEQKSGSSSSSSGDSKLLDINFSLAEKLKGLTPEQVRTFDKEFVPSADPISISKAEEDLVRRLRALKETPIVIDNFNNNQVENQVKSPVSDKNSSKKDEGKNPYPPKSSHSGDTIDFVPLLLDIPKVPTLATDSSNTKHKKPPPSKSLLAARKFNDFIVPHELSTIPEQDSQMRFESTLRDKSPVEERRSQVIETIPAPKKSPPLENKVRPKSPLEASNKSSTSGIGAKLERKISIKDIAFVPPSVRNTSSPIKNPSETIFSQMTSSPINRRSSVTVENTNNSDNSVGSVNTSSDEKVEMLRIEAMLRSIGMEWAISTLRKTQETLALTSSSSSIDLKSPSTLKHFNESDIKEYLSKELFQKISSSTLRTDASPGSLNESQEFSDIHRSEFLYKQTSTPVNRSRDRLENPEKSSDLPSAIESDKVINDFFSLPERSP